MHSNHVENPQESLQIKQDDKFYSRLMSKESSKANSSSRVYYRGASGAVPFIWESQPGTPKHPLYNYDNTLPPLTPPPSYQSASKSNNIHKNSKPDNLFATIFFRFTSNKKNHVSPSSSSSSSWSCNKSSSSLSSLSSSTSSSCSGNSTNSKLHRSNCSSSALRIGFGMDDYHEDQQHDQGHGSPTSTLCFSRKHRSPSIFRGCY